MALNIIDSSFVNHQTGTLNVNKFTLYYSFSPSLNVPQISLDSPSFRTSIFKGSIGEARQMLQNISFEGMVINLYEDTCYPQPDLSPTQKTQVMCNFVQFMLREHPDWLQDSYTCNETYPTVIEEEFALYQQNVQDVEEHSASQQPTTSIAFSIIVDNQFNTSATPEPYPEHCTPIIQQAWQMILNTHPHAQRITRVQDVPQHVISANYTTDDALPLHYHGGFVKFICVSDTQWCGLQCTQRGGLRLVFLVDVPNTSTTYISPVNGSSLPLPSFLLHNQTQHPSWFWCDTYVPRNEHQYMNTFREISPDKWLPYPKQISQQIENAFQQQAQSCPITLNIVHLEVQYGNGNLHSREVGVQCNMSNRQRKHFVKRMMITDAEHDEANRVYNDALEQLLENANGEKENCVICLEALKDNKCEKTACDHVFHSLCLQTHLSNQNSCPCCRQAQAQQTSAYLGR